MGGGVSFTFPTNALVELAAGARCLLVGNGAAFTNQFGANLPVVGTFTGTLADTGGLLTLGDVNGNTFATVAYGGSNRVAGYRVVFSGTETNVPAGPWHRSAFPGGSPGAAEPVSAAPSIIGMSWSKDGFQLSFTGSAGRPYTVRASTDLTVPLTNWPALATGTFGSNSAVFQDTASTNSPRRFYLISTP